jgi:hypothetical protein
LIYAAGITRRPVPTRFKEHTRKYINGEYNVLDIATVQQGIRREIWHGWDYARKHREEIEERKLIIFDAVHKQLAGFCIFVAVLSNRPVLTYDKPVWFSVLSPLVAHTGFATPTSLTQLSSVLKLWRSYFEAKRYGCIVLMR